MRIGNPAGIRIPQGRCLICLNTFPLIQFKKNISEPACRHVKRRPPNLPFPSSSSTIPVRNSGSLGIVASADKAQSSRFVTQAQKPGASMTEHTVRTFDNDLAALVRKMKEMSDIDAKQIKGAIGALSGHDVTLARQVIALSDRVDTLQRDIEEEAVVMIARRQPVAADLREIVGALRMSNDLERIGDFAENIAKRVLLIDGFRVDEGMHQLEHMADLVLAQLARVMESYEQHDIAAAQDVWCRDKDIDVLNKSLFRELLTYMIETPSSITFYAHLLFCAKNLERMGDHITNMAETIHYIIEGRPFPGERPKADLTSKEMLLANAAVAS